MKDLTLEPAVKQLEMLRMGEVSVMELAEAHLKQIERLNPKLNAFADLDAERVRAEARRLDVQKEARGPLHGLPVTVKSSIATEGYRCEIGSLLHKGDVPREDAVVVARLRAAGALILGTTNCPEFLMAYETANLLHGFGQRQRGLGACAGTLYRHLLAEADTGTHSGTRAPAAVRGSVLSTGRNWANGADNGGCGSDVSYPQRPGRD